MPNSVVELLKLVVELSGSAFTIFKGMIRPPDLRRFGLKARVVEIAGRVN